MVIYKQYKLFLWLLLWAWRGWLGWRWWWWGGWWWWWWVVVAVVVPAVEVVSVISRTTSVTRGCTLCLLSAGVSLQEQTTLADVQGGRRFAEHSWGLTRCFSSSLGGLRRPTRRDISEWGWLRPTLKQVQQTSDAQWNDPWTGSTHKTAALWMAALRKTFKVYWGFQLGFLHACI